MIVLIDLDDTVSDRGALVPGADPAVAAQRILPGCSAVAPEEHNSAVTSQTVVGKVGTVLSGIRGGDRPGEVRLVIDGIAHYYLGYAETVLPAGASVLVINNRGARQVDVEPWPTVPPGEPARGVEEGL